MTRKAPGPPRPEKPIDWDRIAYRCERDLKMRKWEWQRYTLLQLLTLLADEPDGPDPHAGGTVVGSLAEIAQHLADR